MQQLGATVRERRSQRRITTRGAVLLRREGKAVHARVENICGGGIEVTVEPDEPLPELGGAAFDVSLRLAGATTHWIASAGSVIRAVRRTVVVKFDRTPRDLERELAIIDGHQHELQTPLSMVVDRLVARRQRIATALRAEGCRVIENCTALDVLDWFERGHRAPAAVVIGVACPFGTHHHLAGYLASTYPTLLVLELRPCVVVHDDTLDSQTAAVMHEVLRHLERPAVRFIQPSI